MTGPLPTTDELDDLIVGPVFQLRFEQAIGDRMADVIREGTYRRMDEPWTIAARQVALEAFEAGTVRWNDTNTELEVAP